MISTAAVDSADAADIQVLQNSKDQNIDRLFEAIRSNDADTVGVIKVYYLPSWFASIFQKPKRLFLSLLSLSMLEA